MSGDLRANQPYLKGAALAATKLLSQWSLYGITIEFKTKFKETKKGHVMVLARLGCNLFVNRKRVMNDV